MAKNEDDAGRKVSSTAWMDRRPGRRNGSKPGYMEAKRKGSRFKAEAMRDEK